MKSRVPPDISARPLSMTVERRMQADAAAIYEAWTERFDRWFAEPGELIMAPEVDRPWFFLNRKDWGSHPHYGRFVELEQDRLVVTTWLTGPGGTGGAETLVRVELTPEDGETLLRLTHAGFQTEAACQAHLDNWPEGLAELDAALAEEGEA